MRKLVLIASVALALPALALASPPTASDQANAAKACKSQRSSLSAATFTATYGGGANAYGKCVSKMAQASQAATANASQQCRAEQADPNFATNHGGKTFNQFYGLNKNDRNAFGKCVSAKASAKLAAVSAAIVNAAKSCKADRKTDAATFAKNYGTGRNAFGKCVSAKSSSK